MKRFLAMLAAVMLLLPLLGFSVPVTAQPDPVPAEAWVELFGQFMADEISDDFFIQRAEDITLAAVRRKSEAAFKAQPTAENGACEHNRAGQGRYYILNNPEFEPTVYCYYRDYYYIQCSECGQIDNSSPPYKTEKKYHPQPVYYTKPGVGQGVKCPDCNYIFS